MAFSVYRRCQGDWQRDAGGHITGLPVTAIEATMRIMQIHPADRLDLLDQVLTIASVIMTEIRKERQRNAAVKS